MTSSSDAPLPSEKPVHPTPRPGDTGLGLGSNQKQSLLLPENDYRKTQSFIGESQDPRGENHMRDFGEKDGAHYDSHVDLGALPRHEKHEKGQAINIPRQPPVFTDPSTYSLTRYVPRALLNSLGPILVTAFYFFIVFVYILRPSVNEVIPGYPINAKGIFFTWVILSIFVLDWAKSALAGFEAFALTRRGLAPRSAQGLMWHTDRGWGSLSGWWKASVVLFFRLRHFRDPTNQNALKLPGILWLYLALNSFILYAAIPLAGLSMDIGEGYKLSDEKVWILGANNATFDNRPSNGIAEEASSRWRQGNPTTPHGETIFYAPSGTESVSSTYFEDSIQAIHSNDIDTHNDKKPTSTSMISVFSGPQVSERVHGRAWGLLTSMSCEVVHPYTGLHILNVSSINDWSCDDQYMDSTQYDPVAKLTGGIEPLFFNDGVSQGVNYVYLIATDSNNGITASLGYVHDDHLLNRGALELVMWQAYRSPSVADDAFGELRSHPSVVSSKRTSDGSTYLGYGIRCSANSSVGFADLNAGAQTYTDFTATAAKEANNTLLGSYYQASQYRGILTIENIVYGAFTTMQLGNYSLPACTDDGTGPIECGPWYGANAATGATYELMDNKPHFPTISPANMKLAMYKLFGETSIAMMASGNGPWRGELYRVELASDLVPGRVPWQIVVCLLCFWTLITVLPSLWTMNEKRWAATLDGLEMFRLGAEWKDAVRKFQGAEIGDCGSLQDVPGMVGDMDVAGKVGFIGLSKNVARSEGRIYAFSGGPG